MSINALSTKQVKAIGALLSEPTNLAAAAAVGVNPKTLNRWLNNPEFTKALKDAEANLITDNVRALLADLSRNRETLIDIRDDLDNPPGVRLRAAQILDASAKTWRDLQNIETRIAALEAAIFEKYQ